MLVCAAFGPAGACGPLAGNVVDEAATKAVEAPIDTLKDPEKQQKLEELIADPQIQESIRTLSRAATEGATRGVFDGLTADDGELRAALAGALADLRPEINEMVAQATDTAVRTMMAAAADAIEQDLAPSLRRVTPSDVTQTLLSPLQDSAVHDTVGALAETIGYHAMLGTDRGIQMIKARQEAGVSQGPLALLGVPITVGWLALLLFIGGVGSALLAMSVLLYKGRTQRRSLEVEGRRREALLLHALQAMLTRDLSDDERRKLLGEFERLHVPGSKRSRPNANNAPPPSVS